MNNLAYKQTPEYKYIKKAFIDKGGLNLLFINSIIYLIFYFKY
ncbi:hypothetical protein QIA30_05510 (plasmid) [Borreliella turdi]